MNKLLSLCAAALMLASSNSHSMDAAANMGMKIGRILGVYQSQSDAGLLGFELKKEQGLVIETTWENSAAVYRFYQSEAHGQLKAIFGLGSNTRLIRRGEAVNNLEKVKVINRYDDGEFSIEMLNID